MPNTRPQAAIDWAPVAGRALAFLCLHYADMRSETLLAQAEFLGRFGLPRSEAALILGTTEASLSELARRQKRKSTSRANSTRNTTTRRARTRAAKH